MFGKKKLFKPYDELMADAKVWLEKARNKYMNVISEGVKTLRYYRANNISGDKQDRVITSIKKAYYGISIVDNTKQRLAQASTEKELFSAMNATTKALGYIYRADIKSEKPKQWWYDFLSKRTAKRNEKDIKRIDEMLDSIENINNCVDTSIVEKLVAGGPVSVTANDLLMRGDGISVDPNDLLSADIGNTYDEDFNFAYDPEL